MAKSYQSIENLIEASKGILGDDTTAQSKFLAKQEELKRKNIEKLTAGQADSLGLPYVYLVGFPVSPDALALMPEADARRLGTVCFFYDGGTVAFACISYSDEVENYAQVIADSLFAVHKIYYVSHNSLEAAMLLYRSLPKISDVRRGVKIEEKDFNRYSGKFTSFAVLQELISDANTSEILIMLIACAIQVGASDIHVEAGSDTIKARYRIDGVLHDAAELDKIKWKKIISRFKLLSGVKINIDNKPQDGRFSIFLSYDKIDVRSSFLPTAFGESLAMRLLRKSSIRVGFDELGLNEPAYNLLKKEIVKPNGLILTTGPTGSGKTTTLYAVLRKVSVEGNKIVTLEDPIEYQLESINQSQVDPSKNYTFAKGLSSILRQDPDIVMVGEIRDLETADIAIQAGLTGHLVLSTLHTNDAAGVIPRMIDMGVKPYFLAPAINCMLGQRLVRKLCEYCKQEDVLSKQDLDIVKKVLAVVSPKSGMPVPVEFPKFYTFHEGGCEKCNSIGYKGRIGVYEIIVMDEKIKELAAQSAPSFRILEQAIENGMLTMLQDGIFKCMQGITSLEEVFRVIGKFEYVDKLYDVAMSKTIGRGVEIPEDTARQAKDLSRDLKLAQTALPALEAEKLLKTALGIAVEAEANDLHIEPAGESVKIRLRIDGILYDAASIRNDQYLPILSQIKLISGFPTNVKKSTWDGRFGILYGGRRIDCRISIISGGYGETVVVRILSIDAQNLMLDALGIRDNSLDKILRAAEKSVGAIITSGPTGSGKTTTLYALLNKLNKPDVKIITIEDPIEYRLDGAMQTQIDVDQGYTFPAALRSLLRQNPNVIMVGEIRDAETAEVAVQSSMTGHLVLSTVHANSAAGIIPRMASFNIESRMLAGSINCMIGQRLARKICPYCKEEQPLSAELSKKAQAIIENIPPLYGDKLKANPVFYRGKGCEKCSGLGYKGRIGVYEVFEMTENMQKLILEAKVIDSDIETQALKDGSLLMVQDAMLKAIEGITTIDEILRVSE